jgi:hypothetical protein
VACSDSSGRFHGNLARPESAPSEIRDSLWNHNAERDDCGVIERHYLSRGLFCFAIDLHTAMLWSNC